MATLTQRFKDALLGVHYDTAHQATLTNLFANSPSQVGQATLVAGSVTIPCTSVTATSLVFLSHASNPTTAASLYCSAIVPGVSITVTSTNGSATNLINYAVV